jgi:Tfp pilus assembly ATPase PilU
MKTMEQSLLELCVSKQILEEEALARTTHQEELKRMIDSAMAASRGRGASMMKR